MASSISITKKHSHDATQFNRLITGHEVKVFADKAYDSRKIFNLLRNNGTEAIIPLRKNFRTISRGSPLRGKTAREIRKLGEEEWKHVHEYGKRWTVEIYFSGLKRVMGEVIVLDPISNQSEKNGLHDPGGWPEGALLQHDAGKYQNLWVVMQHS